MIIKLFIFLLALSFLALAFAPKRGLRLWSSLFALAAVILAVWVAGNQTSGIFASYVHPWLSYGKLKISFNLTADSLGLKTLSAVLALAALLIYYNTIAAVDNFRPRLNGILLLSVAGFMLLFSAHDFVQLMIGSCLYTVLGFYLLDVVAGKRKYLFYNFIGEMALFTALAVVYGSVDSVNLPQALSRYQDYGQHRDLVTLLVSLALVIKSGLFPFQNQFQDNRGLSFSRIIAVTAILNPLASLVLLLKLSPLLHASAWGVTAMTAVCVLSALWGGVGMLLIDNLKAKVLYLNQNIIAFMAVLLLTNPVSFPILLTMVLPIMVILDYLWSLVYISASNEVYVSQMGGFVKFLKLDLLLLWGGILTFVRIAANQEWSNLKWALLFVITALVGLAHICRQIYFGAHHADERVEALLHNAPIRTWLPLVAAMAVLWYVNTAPAVDGFVYGGVGLFAVVLLLNPFKRLMHMADSEIQDADGVEQLFRFSILMPIKLLGRILWITIDFLFIERTIIGSVSALNNFMVNALHRIQNAVWLNYLLMVGLGAAIMLFYIGRSYYE